MKFSILAPGHIAHKMAQAVSALEKVELYAVASRDYGRARDFAAEWGFQKAYGSYEELAADPDAGLIYIASPHSHHYCHARMCLDQGRHVLVEKAFTVNAAQAEELIRLSEEKQVLLAEAIWTRYMPSRRMIDELVASGVVGNIHSITANLGYALQNKKERLEMPELGGGALLDLGVYPINFALMVFGDDVEQITSSAVMSPLGVDWMNSITLNFKDRKMAVLHSTMLDQTDRRGIISGDKGYIEIKNINNCEEIRVLNLEREVTAVYPVPEQINGYEYEVLACIQAIEEGKIECPDMPHEETLRVMRLMDAIRREWGMTYPCENI